MNNKVGFCVGILFGLLIIGYLWDVTNQPSTGLTRVQVIPKCSVYFYEKTHQPMFTISLDCAGVDSIRIWPFPIIQPFNDDWRETIPMQLTG